MSDCKFHTFAKKMQILDTRTITPNVFYLLQYYGILYIILTRFTRSDKYLSYIVYTNLAEVAVQETDYDKAIGYALKAIQCVDEKVHSDEYYSAQAVIGQLYIYKKDTSMAMT